MTPNNLTPPKQAPRKPLHQLRLMSHLPQLAHDLLTNPLFQINSHIQHRALVRHARSDTDARRVKRGLRMHLESQHVKQDLDVALGLHEAAHDAVDTVQRTVVDIRYHSRDDGMIRSLIRRQHIRVVSLEFEIRATVLQREAAALRDDAGAETGVIAVNEGDAVSVAICDSEVDRVGVVMCWRAVVEWRGGLFWVEDLGAFGEVGF
jgi:hypothetical protein